MSVPRSLDVTTFQDGIVRSSLFSLPVSMMRMVMMLMMMMMVTMVMMMMTMMVTMMVAEPLVVSALILLSSLFRVIA